MFRQGKVKASSFLIAGNYCITSVSVLCPDVLDYTSHHPILLAEADGKYLEGPALKKAGIESQLAHIDSSRDTLLLTVLEVNCS